MLIEANALYPRKLPIFNITDKGIGVNHPKELNKNHILILHGGARQNIWTTSSSCYSM